MNSKIITTEKLHRLNAVVFLFIIIDYSKGFGGKFGVQNDRQDSSALGWDHVETVEKHGSQRGKLSSCGGSGGGGGRDSGDCCDGGRILPW